MWKHTRIQVLCASNSSEDNKTDYNIHTTTDDEDYESDSDRFCKHLKN